MIKALVFKLKYIAETDENSDLLLFEKLEEEINSAKVPVKNILYSLRAQTYWQYYQAHRWEFYDRTETVEYDHKDIRTWDLRTILKETINNYQLSLDNANKLKKISIADFEEILAVGNTRHLRPTVYDLLVHRAVDFYSNDQSQLIQPAYQFELDDNVYFSDSEKFSQLQVSTKDSLSLKYNALILLQDLTSFHLKDKTKEALLDVELKRLAFVYRNSVTNDKVNAYEKALLNLLMRYDGLDLEAEINYPLALLYSDLGSKYDPDISDEYKWNKKKAYDLCRKVVELYPNTPGAQNCRSLMSNLEFKNVSLQIENVNLPEKPILGLCNYKNIDLIYYRIYKTDYQEIKNVLNYNHSGILDQFRNRHIIEEGQLELPLDGDMNDHSVEVKLPALPLGQYVMLMSYKSNFKESGNCITYNIIEISNLSIIQRNLDSEQLEFYVLNRDSGVPVKDVEVIVWTNHYNDAKRKYVMRKANQFEFDKEGHLIIDLPISGIGDDYYFNLQFQKGDDKLLLAENFYNYSYRHDENSYLRTFFFTDRAIYRPGQTVYFKGIILETDGRENELKTGFRTTVELIDVNYQKLADLKLITNEYGTFSGSFVIPQGVLTGNFHISNDMGEHHFSVEEYKRPTFEVHFDPVEESFALGDEVSVKGNAKAYAGFNIDNAELTYRVVRTASFPRWWYFFRRPYSNDSMEITNGTAQTDNEGNFEIKFRAIPDLKIPKEDDPAFNYQVIVDVTDINGETRGAQQYVRVGYSLLRLQLGIPDKVDQELEKFEYEISSLNLNGQYEPSSGSIKVYKLDSPDKIFRSKLWQKPDIQNFTKEEYYQDFPSDQYDAELDYYRWEKDVLVWDEEFDTEKDKFVRFKKSPRLVWDQGVYLVIMEAEDKLGNPVIDKTYFTLYSKHSKNLPYKMPDWFSTVKTYGEPGEKAIFLIGSSNEIELLYEVEHDRKIVESKRIKLNGVQRLIEFPIKEEYRGNFAVHFSFVKDNRLYNHSATVTVPWTNKQLNVQFETFRDKLQPGEMEEWRIKISDNMGDAVAAEMLATLYDASLDAFRANYWSFDVNRYYYATLNWSGYQNFNSEYSNQIYNNWNNYVSGASIVYDRLDLHGLNWYRAFNGYRDRMMYSKSASFSLEGISVDNEMMEEVSDNMQMVGDMQPGVSLIDEDKASGSGAEEQDFGDVEVRSNFNETAFFYPHLKTDEDGNIIVSFTVPQSLTKWKMMGLAHTKDLKSGMIYNELVTSKDLMIMPNAPRFFREGDSMKFTAKISNLSDKDLEGGAILELFDALTMKPMDLEFKNEMREKTFSVKKEQSTLVSWDIVIPEGVDAVTYRIKAKSGNFSDGEEKPIPILSNRMLVTESLPLPVRGNQTKVFKFEKLLNSGSSETIRNHKLTLEFTSNPAWYAIQALPYLMEYPYECSEQIFSRYYANSIASHIANSDPKIKRVFDRWRDLPDSKALLSNLEKNQELKSLLLEETPWVLDAKDESERKRRVGILFDLNRMSRELDSALRKLQQTQLSNGGWPWFKGMRESRYITQHVVSGFGHLDKLNVENVRKDNKVWKMVEKAVLYLDDRIREDYEYLLSLNVNMEADHLSRTQIHYLYGRSYFLDIPVEKRNREAVEYYRGQAEKYWTNKSKYMQGMIALALQREDKPEIPLKIIASLKEYATYSEELGMYWKDFWLGYHWYQAPIETQALFIEAFDEIGGNDEDVEDMKVWLLKQKQTQDWRTTKATVEACYALLLRGTDFLSQSEIADVKLNDKLIDPKEIDGVEVEAGTGYFKTSWSGGEIVPEMGNVEVTNKNQVVAWGALYWQYYEDLDKITPHETPLKLDKKLFVERFSDAGKILEPIDEDVDLDVGNRVIVRIELRVDRDMEFVHMKDMRASCMEPENVISRFKWQGGLGYYESTRDASTNFFFDYLPKGTYVFEYPLRVTHTGDFSNGITTIQSMYAPEFTSHSEGIRVKVEN
ncbi:alpha-2-macroglobulin [Candidatus Cloacimonadota bacterium]